VEMLKITINGMSCGHCVRQVDGALRRLTGVEVQAVQVGEASVLYDPSSISRKEIAQAVQALGYQANPTGRDS
jgi:copper chaperone CopZ